MKVLLTGGAGFIGSHIAVELLQAGHDVVIYDNLCNSDINVVARIKKITNKDIDFVKGDIRDYGQLVKLLSNHQIDIVIHLAGLKAVGESNEIPIDYFDNNVCGTVSLLRAMEKTGVKRLIFSSSATVYGVPQYLPIDENHTCSSTNPYGRTKLHIEEILKDVVASGGEWSVICLRYFNPVGGHASGLLGETPRGIPNNLFPYVAKVAKGELDCLQIFGNDYDTHDGTGVRDYIHVVDLAKGHSLAADFSRTHVGWLAVNLGTGKGYSVLDIVHAYEAMTGRKIPYVFKERRLGDVASCWANPTLAKELLGWQASLTLEEMCVSSWNFESGNNKW